MKLEMPKVNMNMIGLIGVASATIGLYVAWTYRQYIWCYFNPMRCVSPRPLPPGIGIIGGGGIVP